LDRGFAAAEDEEEEQNLQRFFGTIQSPRSDTFRFFFFFFKNFPGAVCGFYGDRETPSLLFFLDLGEL
jgi:hypothetical protein